MWSYLLAMAFANPGKIAEIYASEDDVQRREALSSIVFVPGILGSQIVDETDGRLYWGEVFGQAARPHKGGGDLVKLALPLAARPGEVASLDDELGAGDMLLAVSVDTPFGEVQARGYPGVFEGLVSTLVGEAETRRVTIKDARKGDLPFVAFGYDWRRDLASEAARLDTVVRATAAARAKGGGPAKVTLVGHSMGALVVRYYLRYGAEPLPMDGPLPEPTWAGAEHVADVLLVAPPNAGSPLVFESLHRGEKVNGLLPRYPPALVATFPSLYQMLPRNRHGHVKDTTGAPVDLFDVDVWTTHGLGPFATDQAGLLNDLLPDRSPAAVRNAMVSHVAACLARAARMQAALDQPSTPPETLRLHLFAGDMHPTPSVLTLDPVTHEVSWVDKELGDGRVTRRSALSDERALGAGGRLQSPIRWSSVWFGRAEHFAISRDSGFLDNALYLMLEHPWSGLPPR